MLLLAVGLIGGGLLAAHGVSAATLNTGIEQGSAFQSALGLGSGDIRVIIGNIIRAGLGLLGVLAVCIIVYAGFLWMTAAGNEERVEKARRTLINAVIGLVIILSSLIITTFVINKLVAATGGGGGTTSSSSSGGSGSGLTSTSKQFVVSSITPSGTQTIKNLTVRLLFNRNVDTTTVDDNIVVTLSGDTTPIDGTLSTSGSHVTFTPTALCSGSTTEHCFSESTAYTVTVKSGLKSSDGLVISCGGVYHACTESFTSGTLIDVTAPTVSMSYPADGESISVDSSVTLQAATTDDAGVSMVTFDGNAAELGSVQPDGDTPTSYLAELPWDTTGVVPLTPMKINATANDVNDHSTTSDTITVIPRATHCFDDTTNDDETGLNCGGNDCGACGGSSCTTDSDCSSGVCSSAGLCVDEPEITDISPADGAPGTYVTITGTGFGTTSGTVKFGDTGASLASCSNSWSNTQVIAVVPSTLTSGTSYTITLTTSDGNADTNQDNRGTLIDDFKVDDVVRPGICGVSPSSGTVGSSMTLSGTNFGASQGTSKVYYGTTVAGSYASWADTSVATTVPTLVSGRYVTTLWNNGNESNPIYYTVTDANASSTPAIGSFSPSSGPIGQYVTISGDNFGSSIGVVYFTNSDKTSADYGKTTAADVSFPAACASTYWSQSQLIVKVPSGLDATTYDVTVKRQDNQTSPAESFTVTAGTASPGICAVSPTAAPGGYSGVVIDGDSFGSSQGVGNVAFYQAAAGATVSSWSNDEVVVDVPSDAKSGPMTLTDNNGNVSNATNFEIGNCTSSASLCDSSSQQCCSSGACIASGATCPESTSALAANYAWYFSTGSIPHVPQVLVQCDSDVISPTPWNGRSGGGAVCVNAAIAATFDTTMDPTTFTTSNITLAKCTGTGTDPCAKTSSVAIDSIDATTTSFTANPATDLDPSSEYQVSLTTGITSAATSSGAAGTPIAATSWQFVTSASSADCTIASVNVSPSEATITTKGDTTDFNAQPLAEDSCVVLNSSAYSWDWTADGTYADLASSSTCLGSPSACQTVKGVQEGTGSVTASVDASHVLDSSPVIVNFTDPYATDYWPSCSGSTSGACVNAAVGVQFNVPIDPATYADYYSIELYKCTDETCDVKSPVPSTASPTISASSDNTEITIDHDDLSPSTYYQVVFSSSIASETSEVPLSKHYGGDFRWTFETRSDATPCAISSVEMSPSSATVDYVGATATFEAQPIGAPDSCSTSGEKLTASDYNWSFASKDTTIASLWSSGEVKTATDKIPLGCTSSCVPQGTKSYDAICGNGTVEPGEDCDDGSKNGLPGDICSSSCLMTGTSACASATDAGCCGNGTLDPGEQCDDGNSASGDGCSSLCLNEGAHSVGLTCGDGVVTHRNTPPTAGDWAGGESCDRASTPGCSSDCLNEGSTPAGAIAGICGDSVVQSPAEDCDDGILNGAAGDSCSSTCLFVGVSACTYSGEKNCCGDGDASEKGKECDDFNSTSGDGCSSICLLEGSSASYASPSWCGDSTVGTGEASACEVAAADVASAFVQPEQVAVAADTAPAKVVNGIASTDITATTSSVTGTGTFNLSCSCSADSSCSDASTIGCGTDHCCYQRPTVDSYTPSTGGACQNALLSLTFSEPMDEGTFGKNISATLNLSSGETCPYSSTTADSGSGWLAFAWHSVVHFVNQIVHPADAATSSCVLPVSFTSTTLDSGKQQVSLIYSDLLKADHTYTVTVTGDPAHDGSGIRTKTGVGLASDYTYTASIGSQPCAFNTVAVADTSTTSSGYFSQAQEQHTYTATAESTVSGVAQAIEPIPGVYDWSWTGSGSWWSTDTSVLATDNSKDAEGDSAVVTAEGKNGSVTISAAATITNDSLYSPSTAGNSVSGSADATANLCENTWPTITAGKTWVPFEDDLKGAAGFANDDGTHPIAKLGGYMNFSLYYCRDAGSSGTSDDYPSLEAVAVQSPASDVLKEYLFEVPGSSDAIGVRVVANSTMLPIDKWYTAQGFTGSPSKTTVDGYPALQDGRTLYVSVPNVGDGSGPIYPDIYAISYNENADDNTVKIYDEMVADLTFNTNLSNDEICFNNKGKADTSSGSTVTCSSDLDCASGDFCSAQKDKLARDQQRLTDLQGIAADLATYGAEHGRCSASTSTSCTTDSDCPGVETCEPTYPTLGSGSFVPAMSVSTWDSWNSVLGDALSVTLPTDPLNKYTQCGSGTFSSYDSATCWDGSRSQYVCPTGSHAYQYQNVGTTGYRLSTDLESGLYHNPMGRWSVALDSDTTDTLVLTAGSSFNSASLGGYQTMATCTGIPIGNSTVCGDGIVGTGETCESGDTSSTSCTAPSCASADPSYDGSACIVDCGNTSECSGGEDAATSTCIDTAGSGFNGLACGTGSVDCTDTTKCSSIKDVTGTRAETCNSSCSGYDVANTAECVPERCGDGIVESDLGETCDDGSHNGEYGYCSTSCTWSGAFYCGDGTLGGGETCDLGSDNGVYTTNPADSCNSDCSGVGPSCGDGIVNGSEQCDGNTDTYAGALCKGGDHGDEECTTDSDCTDADGTTHKCGGAGTGKFAACADTVVDGVTYPTTRTRTCDSDATSATACMWTADWKDISCEPTASCGNGVVEGSEQCDDGNSDNTDSCTNSCTSNVCGDGSLYDGVETCDLGAANGTACTAAYGSTCRYCSSACNYLTASGGYCGDGVLDTTNEVCDGSLVDDYQYFDSATNTLSGTCTSADSGNADPSDSTFTCHEIGICNGGANAGQYCTQSSDTFSSTGSDLAGCGGGTCVFPTCAADCGSTCPFSYSQESVTITSEEAGAKATTALDLNSYKSGSSPDEATLTVPACKVATSLTANLDESHRTLPSVAMMFVLDRSSSMSTVVSGTTERIDLLSEAVQDAINNLFSAYGSTGASLSIGFTTMSGAHGTDANGNGQYDSTEFTNFVAQEPTTDQSTLIGNVNADISESMVGTGGTGTPLYESLKQAIDALKAETADKKYLVIFSDGNIYNADLSKLYTELSAYDADGSGSISGAEYMKAVSDEVDGATSDGMEVFTTAFTSTTCEVSQMARWSSDSCTKSGSSCSGLNAQGNYACEPATNGIEYAYNGTDATSLKTMFTSIIDSIIDITVTVTDPSDPSSPSHTTVAAGSDVSIPLPSVFSCNASKSQSLNVHLTFNGTGTINFGTSQVNMCAP